MDQNRRARILEKIQSGRATRTERLWLKQEGLCFYCWEDLEKDATKEHLHSKAQGGSNDRTNLRVAHMRCNGVVGSLSVDLKLDLHEIGRDKGAEAFWAKAREYRELYGNEKKAYTANRHKRRLAAQKVERQNTPARGDVRAVESPDAAELELEKLALGQPEGWARRLNKFERDQLEQEEKDRRKRDGRVGTTLVDFIRYLDARYGKIMPGGAPYPRKVA